jgi:hypothetical protein
MSLQTIHVDGFKDNDVPVIFSLLINNQTLNVKTRATSPTFQGTSLQSNSY